MAEVGAAKRVYTLMWDSTCRDHQGADAGSKYDYYINLPGVPWLAQADAPKAYRMYLSTIAFWGGKATPTTTVGLLSMRIEGMSVPCTSSLFSRGGYGGGGNSPVFIIPLTSAQYVDFNGVSKQPIVISALESANLHITWTKDESMPVTDLLDHRVVLTLEPIYD